jgi:serine/threonine protein kinase
VLERELGQGSCGKVVLAKDKKLGRVAIKFVSGADNVQAHRRLRREVHLMK